MQLCEKCKKNPEFVRGKCLKCYINNEKRFKIWYPKMASVFEKMAKKYNPIEAERD